MSQAVSATSTLIRQIAHTAIMLASTTAALNPATASSEIAARSISSMGLVQGARYTYVFKNYSIFLTPRFTGIREGAGAAGSGAGAGAGSAGFSLCTMASRW